MFAFPLPILVALSAPAVAMAQGVVCTDVPGVRIPVPAGWTTMPSEGNVLLKAHGAGAVEFVVAGAGPAGELGDLESDAALSKVNEMVAKLGGDVSPIGEPRRIAAKLGKGVTFAFKGEQNGMELGIRLWLVVRGGTQFTVIALAPPDRLVKLAPTLDTVFAGTAPAEPVPGAKGKAGAAAPAGGGIVSANASDAAKAWAARLGGSHVVLERTHFQNGSGSTVRIDFDFAAGGTFAAKVRSTVSLNVGGAFGGSGISDKTETGTGRWRVIEPGGGVFLELDEAGKKSRFRLEMKGGHVCLDGRAVTVTR
ncbi:MAG: hypothetical protein ACKO5K_01415 [Armatimonadota bacterium]